MPSNNASVPAVPTKTVPKYVTMRLSRPELGNLPMPPDTVALAHFLGTTHRKLWFMGIYRKKLYDKTIRLKKPDGRVRIINPPGEVMKYAQRMAIWRIFSKVPTPSHIGAYTNKRSVKYTAGRHAGHRTIIELDIENFFNSTRRIHVRRFLKDVWQWPKDVAHLFADILTYPMDIPADDPAEGAGAAQVTPELLPKPGVVSIVPQGAPTSPVLCNLIGDAFFDRKILRFLQSKDAGWLYTRYSDNLVISHREDRPRAEVDHIKQVVRSILWDAGYRLHRKKQKVMRPSHVKQSQHLLGLTVNIEPNMPRPEYRRLRAMVKRAETQGVNAVTGTPKNTSPLAHMEGRINYFLHVNPDSPKLKCLKARIDALKARRGGTAAVFKLGERVLPENSAAS